MNPSVTSPHAESTSVDETEGSETGGVGRARPGRRSVEDRQRAVLELMSGKATVDQLARRLGVLPSTVEGWRDDPARASRCGRRALDFRRAPRFRSLSGNVSRGLPYDSVVPHSPTPVDVDGLFAYARVAARARRMPDREVTTVAGRTPRAPLLQGTSRPRAAYARRLAELGLVEPALAAGAEREARDGAQLLERLGRVLRIGTDADPTLRNDVLAARIAALAGGELCRVGFEHLEPEDGEPPDGRISSLPDDDEIPPDAPIVGLVRLRAHVGLASWEVFAIDRGPWLDLPAVLALLNTVLRHQASLTRFVVLRGDGPTARVLAARMDAIEAAVSEGLLELEGPDEALLRSLGEAGTSGEIRT